MVAHIRKSDGKEQSIAEHCGSVAKISGKSAGKAGLRTTSELAGFLHDSGKYTEAFGRYIRTGKGAQKVFHSPVGAIYAYDSWYNGSVIDRLTAQLVSIVIRGHHGGFPDCANTDGRSPYYECIQRDKDELCYSEAVENFTAHIKSSDELNGLFKKASKEISQKLSEDEPDFLYNAGMLARFVLSSVVDADRWDSACFEYGASPDEEEIPTDWASLELSLDDYLSGFECKRDIDRIRAEISQKCFEAASAKPGIYTLNAPTGGGKTLSSLRFAIRHIIENRMDRLFYVIPYNTVLEQNSRVIKDALGGFDGILNHYGNFVSDDSEDGGLDEAQRGLFAERWNAPVILTSIVQFLNTAYKGGNTYARRFCRLANSVIIFDEIQALPKKCTVMFEKLIKFLADKLGCTIVLCTATQPGLNVSSEPLIDSEYLESVRYAFDRTRITGLFSEPQDALSYSEAAARLDDRTRRYGSALMIVNTKAAASRIYSAARDILPDDCLKIHLSTMMCPQHRKDKIELIKEALKGGKPVCCASTALIEAGVDISFPCVIRSLAGLSSIIQSAGRCNRNNKLGTGGGNVEVWYLKEERLGRLADIKLGQNGTIDVFRRFGELNGLEEQLKAYFDFERSKSAKELEYPYKNSFLLSKMISDNTICVKDSIKMRKLKNRMVMYQAFSEVGSNFEVIDEDTVLVIVPYGGGKELAEEISGCTDLKRGIELLQLAQSSAVSVYKNQLDEMRKKDMIYPLGDTGVFALKTEYYDDSKGIVFESIGMEYLGF